MKFASSRINLRAVGVAGGSFEAVAFQTLVALHHDLVKQQTVRTNNQRAFRVGVSGHSLIILRSPNRP